MKRYLSADEAAELLGVSKATLYAYVSRGLIRSEETSSRSRRYLAEDVRKLTERKAARRDPAQVAQDALHWGTPLLDSALTLITDDGLYYRGRAALALARTATLEEVAALLWLDDPARAAELFADSGDDTSTRALLARIDMRLAPLQRMTLALTLADDLLAYDLRPESVARTGARILTLLAAALTGQPVRGALAAHLQQAWRPADAGAARLIAAALILCADHELNVSSFTARVVASAEANPYAVVTAGLAALSGFKHGGNTERVAAFLNEVGSREQIAPVTAARLRRGEKLPGFGHALYANGDPRAQTLLALLRETYPDVPDAAFTAEVAAHVSGLIGQPPNIDFALTALARALRLPEGAPLMLFALGRTVGWIGHASEQYASDALIRPRARYVGAPPAEA